MVVLPCCSCSILSSGKNPGSVGLRELNSLRQTDKIHPCFLSAKRCCCSVKRRNFSYLSFNDAGANRRVARGKSAAHGGRRKGKRVMLWVLVIYKHWSPAIVLGCWERVWRCSNCSCAARFKHAWGATQRKIREPANSNSAIREDAHLQKHAVSELKHNFGPVSKTHPSIHTLRFNSSNARQLAHFCPLTRG